MINKSEYWEQELKGTSFGGHRRIEAKDVRKLWGETTQELKHAEFADLVSEEMARHQHRNDEPTFVEERRARVQRVRAMEAQVATPWRGGWW